MLKKTLQHVAKQLSIPFTGNKQVIESRISEFQYSERPVHWVGRTTNKKLGPIPVSYAAIDKTCPPEGVCALRNNGCYAQAGRIRYTEQGVSRGGSSYRKTLNDVYKEIWRGAKIARHRISGDFLGDVEGTLNECQLVLAMGMENIGYTHSWVFEHIQPLKKYFRASCDNLSDLREATLKGWACELTVKQLTDDVFTRISELGKELGTELKGVHCPAQRTSDEIDCNACTLCKVNEKTSKYVILFYTHGNTKRANKVISLD